MDFGISTIISGGVIASLLSTVYPPIGDYRDKIAYNLTPTKILAPADLLNLFYKGLLSENELNKSLRENGFDIDLAELLRKGNTRKLNDIDYISSFRRGIIDEKDLEKNLKANHINESDIKILKQVSEFFPTPSDLVTFAVREVYSPEIRERFGLDKDRPKIFLTEALKAGLPEEQAKNYWASHWQLPSPRQGFEMLHRRIISEDDLTMLLKALDIVPFWRDNLQKISYNPLTRVDVRRMFSLGVLDENQVKDAYKDLGYNDRNAGLMTDFTKKYNAEQSSELTRASIISAFKKDIITEEVARQYLADSDYTPENIDFYISVAMSDKYESQMDDYVEELTSLYQMGEYTIADIQQYLSTMDLPATYINAIINKIKLPKSKKLKKPSKGDLENWLKLNIIEEVEYFTQMVNLGYKESDIQNYLTEINLETDTSKRKYLPVKTYVRWFESGIMTEGELIQNFIAQNISQTDILNLIEEVKRKTMII